MALKRQKYSHLLTNSKFTSEKVIPTCADYYFEWLLCDAVTQLETNLSHKKIYRSVSIYPTG